MSNTVIIEEMTEKEDSPRICNLKGKRKYTLRNVFSSSPCCKERVHQLISSSHQRSQAVQPTGTLYVWQGRAVG